MTDPLETRGRTGGFCRPSLYAGRTGTVKEAAA